MSLRRHLTTIAIVVATVAAGSLVLGGEPRFSGCSRGRTVTGVE